MLKFHWFLPTASDGRSLTVGTRGTHGPGHDAEAAADLGADRFRAPDLRYLTQIAQAAEHMGFDAILTPTGTWCEDAWLTCAALAQETERLRFLVAFRPGFISPTLAAQMAATFQRISRGRLLLNVVTGGEADEQARFGDHLTKAGRYERCGEFLTVLRGAWSGEPFTFKGEHYDVRGATVMAPPDPIPELYFGGSSAEAGPVVSTGQARMSSLHVGYRETSQCPSRRPSRPAYRAETPFLARSRCFRRGDYRVLHGG